MSQIDDLIHTHCPTGVEHKGLGDVGEFIRGNGLQKSDLLDEGVGAIHYGQIHTYYGTWTSTTKSFVSPSFAARLRRARPGDLIIATTSEDDQAVGKATAWIGADEVAVSGDAYIFRHNLDPKYVAYFFQTLSFREQKTRHITGTKVRRISGNSLAKLRIPVPPLEVQREIVRILDNFTELEAELEARRRQYAHYRDELLTFREAGGVRWIPMGDVSTFTRGVVYSKGDEVRDGTSGIHVLRSNNIDLESNQLNFDDVRTISASVRVRDDQRLKFNDILISAASGSRSHVGKVAIVDRELDAAFGGFMAVIRTMPELSPRYLYYVLLTRSFTDYLNVSITSTTINNLTGTIAGDFVIPVPDRNEQQEIVQKLDELDALVNNLAIGLPAELAARRKQYEYYRDRLLTFPEAAA